jgi:putative aldouronate transport system permease protein
LSARPGLLGMSGLQWRENLVWLLMCTPGLAWYLIFAYLPMPGIVIAFKDYRAADGILKSKWVGLENFNFLFKNSTIWQVTFNTVYNNLLFIVVGLVVALVLAFLLYEVRQHRASRFYPTVLLFPIFFSWVLVASIAYAFLSHQVGLVNSVLKSLGAQPVTWYVEPRYWRAILVLVDLWHGVGFGLVLYYTGLLGINPEIFEAAKVDGAGWWQRSLRISLPLVSPLIIINLILALGHIFSANFALFYLVPRQSGTLWPATRVLDTYVYQLLTSYTTPGQLEQAAGTGLYQSLVGLVLVLTANHIVRRIDRDKSLF